MIKIIHQIWIGNSPIPKRFLERSKKIQEVNKDYKYILWDEDKIIKEFPELKIFINLNCVPAFISNITRIKILKKYGGWYIDLDYDVLEKVQLFNLVNFKEDLPIVLKSDIDGFLFNNGFFYSPKNHPVLNNNHLKNYLPHFPMMIEFNKAILEESNFYNFYFIDQTKVSKTGSIYKEESILSFYKHENYDKFLIKYPDQSDYILEYNNTLKENRKNENLIFNKFVTYKLNT